MTLKEVLVVVKTQFMLGVNRCNGKNASGKRHFTQIFNKDKEKESVTKKNQHCSKINTVKT